MQLLLTVTRDLVLGSGEKGMGLGFCLGWDRTQQALALVEPGAADAWGGHQVLVPPAERLRGGGRE